MLEKAKTIQMNRNEFQSLSGLQGYFFIETETHNSIYQQLKFALDPCNSVLAILATIRNDSVAMNRQMKKNDTA